MSINDSKDLLYIAISLAILGLAFFTSWAVYYLAMILRQSFQVVKEMRDRLHKIDEIMASLKEKIDHSASYLLLIGEGVKKLVEIMKDRGEKKETRKKRV
jgi:CHASE3 domain sensor protein